MMALLRIDRNAGARPRASAGGHGVGVGKEASGSVMAGFVQPTNR